MPMVSNGPMFGWCVVSQCCSPVRMLLPALHGATQSVPLPFGE